MNKKYLSLAVLGVLALMAGSITSNSNAAKISKIDPKVAQKLTEGVVLPVLVVLKEQADVSAADRLEGKEAKGRYVYEQLSAKADSTQGPLVAYLQEQKLNFQQFYIANMIAVSGASAEVISAIAKRDDVAKIYSNQPVQQMFPRPRSVDQKRGGEGMGDNLIALGVDKVWNELGVKGKGIVVAGHDTGYQWDHPALKAKYRGYSLKGVDHNYNWHDSIKLPAGTNGTNKCGYQTQAPCDDDEHGTHTMGTMIGDDGNGNQIGMAPDAQWMGCRNMDSGVGQPSTYIECFEFFLAPYPLGGNPLKDGRPDLSPHVINNSWGCPTSEGCTGDEFLPALVALKKAGIFVVVSAGNDGPSCSTIQDPPAWHSDVTFSVGAFSHKTGAIASFSSRGPSKHDGSLGPDVSAPGVNIRSSIPGGQYAQVGWSGTSMAGPHVVGLAALLMSAHPELIGKVDRIAERIQKFAKPSTSTQTCGGVAGTQIPNNTFGWGTIDAYRTVKGD